jgi:hypothetical protein
MAGREFEVRDHVSYFYMFMQAAIVWLALVAIS